MTPAPNIAARATLAKKEEVKRIVKVGVGGAVEGRVDREETGKPGE
jgi:hypothetical protein